VAAQGPVIPDFGTGSDCVVENRLFCPDWVRDNWSGTLQPALLDHVKLTLIAVAIGFVLSFGAALLTHRLRLFEKPLVAFAAIVYTIPSLALFQLLVPVTGLAIQTAVIPLILYTFLIFLRNMLAGLDGVEQLGMGQLDPGRIAKRGIAVEPERGARCRTDCPGRQRRDRWRGSAAQCAGWMAPSQD